MRGPADTAFGNRLATERGHPAINLGGVGGDIGHRFRGGGNGADQHVGNNSAWLQNVGIVTLIPQERQLAGVIGCGVRHIDTDMQHPAVRLTQIVAVGGRCHILLEIHRIRAVTGTEITASRRERVAYRSQERLHIMVIVITTGQHIELHMHGVAGRHLEELLR